MTPSGAEQHVASYDVLVDGQDLPPEQRDRVKEIRVLDELRLPDVCTLHVTYPRGEGVDRMPFEIGKDLEVRLGARDELAPRSLFEGKVVTIEPVFGAEGCHVTVRAFDRSHALHGSRRIRTFQNQTSSDIVQKILGEAGLKVDCEASGEPHDFMQQDNETDWDFIWRLADRIGFELVETDGGMRFGPPQAGPAVELEWPTTLRSFSPRVTAVQQVGEVTLSAQDARTKSVVESTATSPNQIARIGVDRAQVASALGRTSVHIATEPVTSRGEADALTQALLDRLANGYAGAQGVAVGDPRLKAGAKVTVTGVGSRFSGDYRIARAEHVLRGGGAYVTHIANSPTHTLLGALGASGESPRFGTQLTIGIVTNTQDPDGQGRIRVKYPALESAEGGWARVVTLNAGDERGVLMLPDVGDEVLVAFLHGDTRHPLVLGSLFNGVDRPGDVLLQDRNGSFVVRSAHKAHLESTEDLTIKTEAKLVVEVAGDTSVSGDGTIDVRGREVSVKSEMGQVTIEGTTALTLKCGGSKIELSPAGVTVSGPMISLG